MIGLRLKHPLAKPLRAKHSRNSDIWLRAWTLPISHEQWWVLKLQGYTKYLQHCIRPLSSVTLVPSFHLRKALNSEETRCYAMLTRCYMLTSKETRCYADGNLLL